MCTTTAAFSGASFAAKGPDEPPTAKELEELLGRALASAEPMNRYRTELLRVARDDAPSASRLDLKLSAVAHTAGAVLAGDGHHGLPCLKHLTGELIASQLIVRGDEACVARTLDRLTRLAAGRPDRPDGVQGEVNWVQAVAVAYAMARYLLQG